MVNPNALVFAATVLVLILSADEVEALAGRAVVLLVFAAGALAGEAAGLLFNPGPLAGAPGGVGALVAFFAVLRYANRATFPPRPSWRTRVIVAGFFVAGGLVYAVFVNPMVFDGALGAVVLGGLLAGAVLGLLLVPRRPGALPLPVPPAVDLLGRLSGALLLAGGVGAVVALLTAG